MHKSTGNWHSMLSSVARLRHVHCFSLLGQGNWLRPYSLIANKHMRPPPQKSCLTPAQDRCPASLLCCDRRQALIPRDEFTIPLANDTSWYDTVGHFPSHFCGQKMGPNRARFLRPWKPLQKQSPSPKKRHNQRQGTWPNIEEQRHAYFSHTKRPKHGANSLCLEMQHGQEHKVTDM